MFISNHEKEEVRISIRTLQAQMVHVMDELKALKTAKQKNPVVRTAEAPYGYKKDGTPKRRPGIQNPKFIKVRIEPDEKKA